MSTTDYKKCFYCKEEKPYSEFRKDPYKKDGCTSRCKSCINKPTITVDYSKITHKVCVVCNVDKDYSLYHKKTKNGRITVQSKCKECMAEYKKKRYWDNHEEQLIKHTKSRTKPENILQRKGYYEKNKEDYIVRGKKYWADEEKRKRKLEKSSVNYFDNKEKIRARHKANYMKPETKEKLRQRYKIRKETDVVFVIKTRLRGRLRSKLKDIVRNDCKFMSSLMLLGCDMQFFKSYIESKFTDGMSWDRLPEIHLDHIIPCDKFDLTKIEEQRKCFHYSNIQPLWWYDNLSKGNRIKEQKAA